MTIQRSIVRGTSTVFEALFVEDDGTPIVPVDLSTYPAISIVSPDGTTVQVGVASSLGSGRWRFVWNVPADAELSTNESYWQINWVVVAAGNRQIQFNQAFGVLDHIEATPNERAYTQLVLEGNPERLVIKFRQAQNAITLSLLGAGDPVDLTSRIQHVEQDGFNVYYADTDDLSYGCFLATWRARETVISQYQTYLQQVRVPENLFWILQPDLRMLIDKVQKKDGHVQSYSDSDMYSYMRAGVDIINQADPISMWDLTSFPSAYGFWTYLIAASAWWGLQAQFIAEGELKFSFSGQTVTLDVDRTSVYESAISKLREYLTVQMPLTKSNMVRRSNVGSIATRPYDFGLTSLVGRIQNVSGGSNQILPLMSRLGLL